MKSSLGQVLHGVSRVTLGEFCFVLGVTVLWLLYSITPADQPDRRLFLYLVPVLLLTFADSFAGLVGVYWGRRRYTTPAGRSQEGSAAFFICAVACILIPLLLLPDRALATSLALAVCVGLVLTFVEAMIWSGLDNLVLPLLAYFLLVLH
jgi:phytol kinase